MRKTIGILCLIVVLMFVCLPIAASDCFIPKPEAVLPVGTTTQHCDIRRISKSTEITAYLLIHVSLYTLGKGIRPYEGANISVRGLFFSYLGTTNDQGDCLFQVHTHLLRGKRYVVKVSIPPADWLHTKINTLILKPRGIIYKDFLFIVLKDS